MRYSNFDKYVSFINRIVMMINNFDKIHYKFTEIKLSRKDDKLIKLLNKSNPSQQLIDTSKDTVFTSENHTVICIKFTDSFTSTVVLNDNKNSNLLEVPVKLFNKFTKGVPVTLDALLYD